MHIDCESEYYSLTWDARVTIQSKSEQLAWHFESEHCICLVWNIFETIWLTWEQVLFLILRGYDTDLYEQLTDARIHVYTLINILHTEKHNHLVCPQIRRDYERQHAVCILRKICEAQGIPENVRIFAWWIFTCEHNRSNTSTEARPALLTANEIEIKH